MESRIGRFIVVLSLYRVPLIGGLMRVGHGQLAAALVHGSRLGLNSGSIRRIEAQPAGFALQKKFNE